MCRLEQNVENKIRKIQNHWYFWKMSLRLEYIRRKGKRVFQYNEKIAELWNYNRIKIKKVSIAMRWNGYRRRYGTSSSWKAGKVPKGGRTMEGFRKRCETEIKRKKGFPYPGFLLCEMSRKPKNVPGKFKPLQNLLSRRYTRSLLHTVPLPRKQCWGSGCNGWHPGNPGTQSRNRHDDCIQHRLCRGYRCW